MSNSHPLGSNVLIGAPALIKEQAMVSSGGGGGAKAALSSIAACAAMVGMEGCIIALTITANSVMGRGMSPFVFVVYTNALASIILLPFSFSFSFSFFHHNNNRLENEAILTWPFVMRVFLLGFIGVTIGQNLAFVGLSYSSPIVACGMANQIPAFSFILGIITRSRKLKLEKRSSQASLIGTIISLMGAISLTLYRGPTIQNQPKMKLGLGLSLGFFSTHENWVLGCILFAASSFTLAIWNILQVGAMKMCPQVMKIISLYSLFGTLQSAVLAFFLERDPSAWKLGLNFELLAIILTAVFSSVIRSNVQIWCSRIKGPYFVSIFKPVGIPYACTFGYLFFANTLHYGSMLGACICGLGYYIVLWGQIKDDEKYNLDTMDDDDEKKVPLLLDDSPA